MLPVDPLTLYLHVYLEKHMFSRCICLGAAAKSWLESGLGPVVVGSLRLTDRPSDISLCWQQTTIELCIHNPIYYILHTNTHTQTHTHTHIHTYTHIHTHTHTHTYIHTHTHTHMKDIDFPRCDVVITSKCMLGHHCHMFTGNKRI